MPVWRAFVLIQLGVTVSREVYEIWIRYGHYKKCYSSHRRTVDHQRRKFSLQLSKRNANRTQVTTGHYQPEVVGFQVNLNMALDGEEDNSRRRDDEMEEDNSRRGDYEVEDDSDLEEATQDAAAFVELWQHQAVNNEGFSNLPEYLNDETLLEMMMSLDDFDRFSSL